MAYGYIQSKIATGAGVLSLAVTFTSACSTNNRLLALYDLSTTNTGTTSTTDDATPANSYNNDLDFNDATNFRDIIASANCTNGGGGARKLTISCASTDSIDAVIAEYSGLSTATGSSAVDTSGHNNSGGAATTLTVTASPNPSASGEAAISYFNDFLAATFTAVTGTIENQGAGSNGQIVLMDVASTTGSTLTSATVSGNGGGDARAIVVYKLAPLASGGLAGVRIANRNVGPWALRFRFRQPSYQSTVSSGPNSFTQSLSGGLSFTGPTNLKNATSKGLASAGLSFTGPTHLLNAITKGLAAAGLSFTGPAHLLNAITKGVTAGLSFTGSALRNAITKSLAAAGLSFTGPAHLVNAIGKGLAAAGLSFSGSIANAKAFLKSLTAGLSFTGPTRLGLSIGKGVAGGLSFTGAGLRNAISKGVAAGLSFAGNLAHTGGGTLVNTVNVALAVLSRHTVMLLRSRFPNLTLASRKSAATVRTRRVALTVTTRKTSLTVRSR